MSVDKSAINNIPNGHFQSSFERGFQLNLEQKNPSDMNGTIYNKPPLDKSIPLKKSENDQKLFKNVYAIEINRINPFYFSTHWHFLDNIIFSEFWDKHHLPYPLGLFLIERTYHVAKNALLNTIPSLYNRANEYFNFSYSYIHVPNKQRFILSKILQKAWEKHKKDINQEDILDISVSFQISDTKPVKCYGISFDVILREIDKSGQVKQVKKCLYSSNDNKDPYLRALYIAIDWSKLRKTYSKKELEILINSEKSKKSSMNCWDHAAIGAILLDKALMKALISLDEKEELKKKDLDKEIEKLKKDGKYPKDFESIYASKISAENRSKYLIDCIFASLFCKDDLEKQKLMIEEYSPFVRKYTFGLTSEDSQEDAISVINYLIEVLSNQNKLPKITVKKTRIFSEDVSEDPRICEKQMIDDTYGILQINLSTYYNPDPKGLKPQEMDANFLMDAYFDNAPFESFEDYDPNDEKKPSNWVVTKEVKRFIEKPQGISFHFERFFQSFENRGSKMNISLKNIPLTLKYEDDKFIADKTGNYQLNSAIIHKGSLDNGHYYLVLKEEDQWYLKDNTKDLADKEALKLDNDGLNEHLKNAVYLHYE